MQEKTYQEPKKDISFSLEQLDVITALSPELLGAFLSFTPEQINAIGWAYQKSLAKKQNA